VELRRRQADRQARLGWSMCLWQCDAASAKRILELLAQREAAASVVLMPARARFPSSANTRREMPNAIASTHETYARSLDTGRVAIAGLFGTESWAEYGRVVLQMAILDALLSTEEKLGNVLDSPEDDSSNVSCHQTRTAIVSQPEMSADTAHCSYGPHRSGRSERRSISAIERPAMPDQRSGRSSERRSGDACQLQSAETAIARPS
jgi:hypothetical protein